MMINKRKGFLKRLFALTVCLGLTSLNISAGAKESYGEQTGNSQVLVHGSVGDVTEPTEYNVWIYAVEKSVSDLDLTGSNPSKNLEALVYMGYGVSDADGSFTINFEIDEKTRETGEYSVVIFSEANASGKPEELLKVSFVNGDDFSATVSLLNQESKKEDGDVLMFLTDNAAKLNFSKAGIDATDLKTSEILKNEILRKELPADDYAKSSKTYRLSRLIASVNEEKTDNLFLHKDLLLEDDCTLALSEELNSGVLNNEEIKKAITKRLYGKNIKDGEEFNKNLYEAIVLEVIKNPDGVANARKVIDAFYKSTGVSVAALTDKELNSIIGKDYSDIDAFEDAKDKADDNSSDTSSGGSSGGSSSGKRNEKPAMPTINAGEKTEIPVDVYVDLEDAVWARDAIVNLTDLGVLSGRSKDRFEPNEKVKREEFAKMLVSAFAPDAEDSDIAFLDVNTNEWYYPYIKKAVGEGIVSGYNENTFGIGDLITRQDMAVMAYRAVASNITKSEETTNFTDAAEISEYAKEAINTLTANGIINGMGDGAFNPKGNATRAEAAKIIYEIKVKLF